MRPRQATFGLAVRSTASIWFLAPAQAQAAMRLFDLQLLLTVLAAAPVLSAVASWLPALLAAQQDPAVILRET